MSDEKCDSVEFQERLWPRILTHISTVFVFLFVCIIKIKYACRVSEMNESKEEELDMEPDDAIFFLSEIAALTVTEY